jgi:hypothetical protein
VDLTWAVTIYANNSEGTAPYTRIAGFKNSNARALYYLEGNIITY